jgi:hypothetical protein
MKLPVAQKCKAVFQDATRLHFRFLGSPLNLTPHLNLNLSITKAGNARLRRLLIELAWRRAVYQPAYAPVKKWRSVLLGVRSHARRKKQLMVALGRLDSPARPAVYPAPVGAQVASPQSLILRRSDLNLAAKTD